MKEISPGNFGLLMAYLLPGFVTLWGLSVVSTDLRLWLLGAGMTGPTLGGFLYVTVVSAAAGLTVGAIRWLLIDTFHHATGLKRPEWNDSLLADNLAAYRFLIEIHYRYYHFYANMAVALAISFALWRAQVEAGTHTTWADTGFVLIELVFIAASRDALRRYYARAVSLLGLKLKENSDDKRRITPRDNQD